MNRIGWLTAAVVALTAAGLPAVAAAPEPPGVSFDVLVSEAWTVHSSAAGGGTTLLKLANGDIINQYWEGDGLHPYGLISSDKGKTWTRTSWPDDSGCVAVLSDGSALALNYMKNVRKAGPGKFTYPRWISRDHWKSWEGPLDTPVSIPNGTGGTGDDMRPFNGPLFWRSMLDLPDGRFLATMYGYFEGDTVPITGFKPTQGFFKYRTMLLQSSNRGASWSLVSTVAYDPSIGQESFCEPALLRLPDGELIVIMRTGYTHDPMYLCRSRDEGRIWTKPASTGLRGVDPRLLLLSNGLIACAYGVKEYESNRRERRIMFSRDAGKSWFQNTLVFAGYGGSYSHAIQLEPNKILYVYDADAFKEPGQTARPRNYLRLATVTLRPLPGQKDVAPTSSGK